MDVGVVRKALLVECATSIREKLGSSALIKPKDFPKKIAEIKVGTELIQGGVSLCVAGVVMFDVRLSVRDE